jgi:hypothetical protein
MLQVVEEDQVEIREALLGSNEGEYIRLCCIVRSIIFPQLAEISLVKKKFRILVSGLHTRWPYTVHLLAILSKQIVIDTTWQRSSIA